MKLVGNTYFMEFTIVFIHEIKLVSIGLIFMYIYTHVLSESFVDIKPTFIAELFNLKLMI